MKSRIVEHLGQSEILLPSLITAALAANDRAKLRMSVLQAAAQRARSPGGNPPDFSAECRAAGIDPRPVRALVVGARPDGSSAMTAPGLDRWGDALVADIQEMIHAVAAGDAAEGERAVARLAMVRHDIDHTSADRLDLAQVTRLTAVPHGGDSLHRLVMDLHKSLNRLAVTCAEEVVQGAHAHGLGADDKAAVTAFMRGLARTRALKFDHPGLETTAVRAGARLVIQNDIGTTDAHVLVVTVEADAVTVTYTDVHRSRAQFFIGLFDAFALRWSGLEREEAAPLGEEGEFFLVTGRADTPSADIRDALLEAIGAQLVFLIDWNKARKVLRSLVGRTDAVRLLDWAARHGIGQRAFLELGGGELVAAAIRHAAPTRIGFGERLEVVLGREGAVDFLRTVLRVSTETLLQGRSVRLAKDAIEAELVRHLDHTDSSLLAVAVRQAGLAREIGVGIAQYLADRAAGRPADPAVLAGRAKRIEEKADRIAFEARGTAARLNVGATIAQLIDTIEEAIDELEQAAFVASLLGDEVDPAILRSLQDLCASVVSGVEAAASGIDAAGEVPEGRRADSDDALAATTRLSDLERICDGAERAVTALVLRRGCEVRAMLAALELARALERASDRLAGVGHLLRTHVMAHLAA